MSVPLRKGSTNLCGLSGREAGKESVSSVSVLLSQPASSNAVWRFRLEAQTAASRGVVGSWQSSNPQAGSPTSRVIALATVPGAVAWFVTAELVSGTPGLNELIDLAACECCAELGLVVLDGPNANNAPASGQSYHVLAAGVAGAPAIPAGKGITGIAAWCDPNVLNATVQVGADPIVAVPPGGSVQLTPPLDKNGNPTLKGPVTVTFTNTSGFAVEGLA